MFKTKIRDKKNLYIQKKKQKKLHIFAFVWLYKIFLKVLHLISFLVVFWMFFILFFGSSCFPPTFDHHDKISTLRLVAVAMYSPEKLFCLYGLLLLHVTISKPQVKKNCRTLYNVWPGLTCTYMNKMIKQNIKMKSEIKRFSVCFYLLDKTHLFYLV